MYFVFSDVHGHYSLLRKELKKAGFDMRRKNHILISLGDNFDRGYENYEMFQFLKRMEKSKRLIKIQGNHEDLMIEMIKRGEALPHDYTNRTHATLCEIYKKMFGEYFEFKPEQIDKIIKSDFYEFISNGLDYYQLGDYVFTHGSIPLDKDEPWAKARWRCGLDLKQPVPGKTLVVGHWEVLTRNAKVMFPGEPENWNKSWFLSLYKDTLSHPFKGDGVIGIDATTSYSGRINILKIEGGNLCEN